MTVKYGIVKSEFNKDSYRAVVTKSETVDMDKIMEMMIERGSIVSKSSALAVLTEFKEAVTHAVEEGYVVSTDLFKIRPSVSGEFDGFSDYFKPNKHSIHLNMTPSDDLKEAATKIKPKRVSLASAFPELKKLVDLYTNEPIEEFTPGCYAALQGKRLKIDESDPEQGLFFRRNDGEVFKIKRFIQNKPSELWFQIPEELNTGTYRLELRTIFRNYKRMREGYYPHVLRPVTK